MNYYCTLFDSFYLSKGLVMYESLLTCSADFHLFIFAFDDTTCNILKKRNLDHATVIPLKDFETEELLCVKKDRTKAEYCWTCTPSTIIHVIEKYKVSSCTYIDADLAFFSDPSVLIQEMHENKKSILITEHRFSNVAKLYEEKRAGRFCVQFMTFMNDPGSLDVLYRWRDQCIEWCYARYEENKFGDQKYLEDWPVRYQNVHILNHHGGGLAPWNLLSYKFKMIDDVLYGTVKGKNEKFNPVFFHFQYVKQIESIKFDIGWYPIPYIAKSFFYLPYLRRLLEIEEYLRTMNMGYSRDYFTMKVNGIKEVGKFFLKNAVSYNVITIDK